jgi:NADH-quinone oxidoreductase subunit H
MALVAPGRALVGVADVNIGFVYLLAVASLSIYGVTLGGWASNNKYSFLGSMRASAGMISYEIPMGASILAVLLIAGSFLPSAIVEGQIANGWYLFTQPFAAVMFFTCILAEANRAPFDNAEAEQELVGGYHTEYSSMRFALFFLAEYAHMITSSSFFVILFLGGYHLPGVHWTSPEAIGIGPVLVKVVVFFTKAMLTVIFMMFVRWTLPRIRYDQVLKLCWQALIPLSITLLVATSIMIYLGLGTTVPMFCMNCVLLGALLIILFVHPPAKQPVFNRRLHLAGSRFSPLPGADVLTAPTDPTALHDDPFAGAATHS